MAHKDLVDWAAEQAEWARDALRRHALAQNFALDAGGKSEVVKRVRRAAGLDKDECAHEPFTADHLQGANAAGPRTLLVSLGSVKNLARLAPNQTLSFAVDGITLVYGDNGTGKSGYCRITKKLCRSLTSEELIGDVFTGGAKPPAEVQVRYLCEGDEQPVSETWQDGTPPPSAIANISVFDSRNARLYVDTRGKVRYTLDGDCVNLQLTSLAARGAIRRLPRGGYQAKSQDAIPTTARRHVDIPIRLSATNFT